ncbi:MAG: adenine deaminase [Chitinophagales bacterium]
MNLSSKISAAPRVVEGNIVDVIGKKIFPGRIEIESGKIKSVHSQSHTRADHFVLPGLIDAHVHIESSMVVPAEFARIAVTHGTVGTVSDPHEIANVLGIAGIDFMLTSGNKVPFYFNFGAPSCVPASNFETAGVVIDSTAIGEILQRNEFHYLSEMMNYPGVLSDDREVMKKISAAKKLQKPVDGHAPGLKGNAAVKYINAGISTDHECTTYDEAKWKLQHGMKILIREGSAAKNFEALISLLDEFPDMIMFCSDDKHPDDLVKGHMNELVIRALNHGCDMWNVLRAVTLNPVLHYKLECGLLRLGDSADFIVIDNFTKFNVLRTVVCGELIAEEGQSFISRMATSAINNFKCTLKSAADFSLPYNETSPEKKVRVIEAIDGQLTTKTFFHPLDKLLSNHGLNADIENDILKFTVVNRYSDAKPAVAFIKNFGLRGGAIASSVGHDSHNILSVGVSDEMISRAVNLIIRSKGGLAAVTESDEEILPLPVAGLMSDEDIYKVAEAYSHIDSTVRQMGSSLHAPFMTLSFMALLVIPQLKLSDKGLFDGERFEFISLIV